MKELDANVRSAIAKPSRTIAPFRWYGGKGRLARWVVQHLPEGKVYVEPFAGAASVFWNLPRPYPVEVLNDIDGEIVNLFRVIQNPETFEAFAHRVTWTPYSLDEFRRALQVGPECKDPVTRAWAFFVRQNQGFAGLAKTEGRWGRAFTPNRGMAGTANSWRARMRMLEYWHDRLTRVQIDNRDAIQVIKYWDTEDTVFYVDPPYAANTRIDKKVYDHELEDNQHTKLVEVLLDLEGKVLLSGYDSDLYSPLEEAGWEKVCREMTSSAASRGRDSKVRGTGNAAKHAKRIECLWISPGVVSGALY